MKISVIMPALNAEKYVDSTLATVVKQTYDDWEAVIVDGGSIDGTLAKLDRYAEKYPNIHVYRDKCESAYQAILKAFALCTGDVVCVLCFSDGYLADDWFALCAEAFGRDPEISLVWGMPVVMTENGKLSRQPPMIYAPFYEKSETGWWLIGREVIRRLRHPSLIGRLFSKNRREWKTKLVLASEVLNKKQVLQKQDWFWYWIKTGTLFPDPSMCVARRVMQECFAPYTLGSHEPGDWGVFYFNFNSRGYLSHCIPKIISFGLDHKGRLSDRVTEYADATLKEYFERIAILRETLELHPENMVFRDRAGSFIK